MGLKVFLTSVVFGVALLQGGGGLDYASIKMFDQSYGRGSLIPADRVAVRPGLNGFLQCR